jgi:hypothetical protein
MLTLGVSLSPGLRRDQNEPEPLLGPGPSRAITKAEALTTSVCPPGTTYNDQIISESKNC